MKSCESITITLQIPLNIQNSINIVEHAP